jgi:hypothetical protein
MRYRVLNVNYWQQGDKKCHFELRENIGIIIIRLISYTYVIAGLAQKLHYFCSPIKTLTGDTK